MTTPEDVDWFRAIHAARMQELRSWPKVAALLWAAELSGDWWSPQYDNRTDALAQPEIQLQPSTAKQYIDCWEVFRHQPIEELERARPRLLNQAVPKLMKNPERAAEAVSDAQTLSWSSFRAKWNPIKEPPPK